LIKYNAYDAQEVKVIGITKSLIEGVEGAEELIGYMARVSNPSNQMNTKTTAKLLKYCARNAHWSIFGMVNVNFEVTTTRDIGRQLLRHTSIVPQEFSQRYADPTKDLFFVIREARLQDDQNRQNSVQCSDQQLAAFWEEYQKKVINLSTEAYQWAISHHIAKEQARVVLPEGNTGSKLYLNANLRSIIHYCDVRRGNGTQKEHIDLADKIWYATCEHFPFLLEFNNQ
jgi:thymidylate synthase (FAD)